MDRRLFLSVIAGTAALPNMLRALPLPPPQPHRLNLANPHTGETFSGIYRDDNGPIPRVMEELSLFLRDFHSGERIAIDVGVVDFLMGVMQAVGQTRATILSAYRTPATNAMLARTHFSVAESAGIPIPASCISTPGRCATGTSIIPSWSRSSSATVGCSSTRGARCW